MKTKLIVPMAAVILLATALSGYAQSGQARALQGSWLMLNKAVSAPGEKSAGEDVRSRNSIITFDGDRYVIKVGGSVISTGFYDVVADVLELDGDESYTFKVQGNTLTLTHDLLLWGIPVETTVITYRKQ